MAGGAPALQTEASGSLTRRLFCEIARCYPPGIFSGGRLGRSRLPGTLTPKGDGGVGGAAENIPLGLRYVRDGFRISRAWPQIAFSVACVLPELPITPWGNW